MPEIKAPKVKKQKEAKPEKVSSKTVVSAYSEEGQARNAKARKTTMVLGVVAVIVFATLFIATGVLLFFGVQNGWF